MLGGEAPFGPNHLDTVPELLAQHGCVPDEVGVPGDRVLPVEELEQESELLVGERDWHALQCTKKYPPSSGGGSQIFCRRH